MIEQIKSLDDVLTASKPAFRCVSTADLITSAIRDSYDVLRNNERVLDFLEA